MSEGERVEGTIDRDILPRIRKFVYEYMHRYNAKPKAIALGPEEYLNFENATRSEFRMIYDEAGGDRTWFEGIQVYVAPINGILALEHREKVYQVIDAKRRLLEGLQ